MSYSHSFDWDVTAWVTVEFITDFTTESGFPQINISPCSPYTLSFTKYEALSKLKKCKDNGFSSFILPISIDKSEILRISEEIQSLD